MLVHSDLHPEIVELLLQTMTETHSGQEIFQRSGEFPNGMDAEYPVAATAIDYYKNGPSYLRRHLPLWLSVHVQRAIAVLVAGVAIGLPLFHYLPLLLQMEHASASALLVRPTQGFGSLVRCQSDRQTFA